MRVAQDGRKENRELLLRIAVIAASFTFQYYATVVYFKCTSELLGRIVAAGASVMWAFFAYTTFRTKSLRLALIGGGVLILATVFEAFLVTFGSLR